VPKESIDEYPPSSDFIPYIYVRDVFDLYGFEFKLWYDPAVLTVNEIFLGDFFPPDSIIWRYEIHNDAGYVWYAVSLPYGYTEGVGGEGTLAYIWCTVGTGATILTLDETILGESPAQGGDPIPHLVENGYFTNVGTAPIASFTVSNPAPEEKETVVFDGSSSVSINPIVSYFWQFGDPINPTATGVIASHIYGRDGTYTATLTITDSEGYTDSASTTITVKDRVASLAKKAAWPEHQSYKISIDEDGNQTLFAMVKNYASTPTLVRVVFNIYYAEPLVVYRLGLPTAPKTLGPKEISTLYYNLTAPPFGHTYYAEARTIYWDPIAEIWVPASRVKGFHFKVVL